MDHMGRGGKGIEGKFGTPRRIIKTNVRVGGLKMRNRKSLG
jgi:hypothetical protein